MLLVAASAVLPLPAASDDLLSVYAEARRADPMLAGARAARGVSHERVREERAALLPQWSIGAGGRLDALSGEHAHSVSSILQQTSFDLSQWKKLASATSMAAAADASVEAAEQRLCARVANANIAVLSATAALATARANEDAYARQVAEARARYDSGISALVDVEQARAYLELSLATRAADQKLLAPRVTLRCRRVSGDPAGDAGFPVNARLLQRSAAQCASLVPGPRRAKGRRRK